LSPKTDYDGDVAIAELDGDFFQQLESLAPFGIANPEPVLRVAASTFVSRPKLFGKDGDHIRCALTDAGGGMREMLAWRAKDCFSAFSATGNRFDFLVRPQAGYWRGTLQPRLVFVDGKTL
jgi:single-stranded DNA-specific DHH superfamily exonuclease